MKKYKCVNITICQVDNGFEVDFSASFQNDVQKGNTGGIESMYVAKTEKEVIAIITKVLPEIKESERKVKCGGWENHVYTDMLDAMKYQHIGFDLAKTDKKSTK